MLAPASINRTLGPLRHMLNWAVGRDNLDRTPFRRRTEVLIRLEREDNKRRRRLPEDDEVPLLAIASPHLRSMIIAALDTGMRLTLQMERHARNDNIGFEKQRPLDQQGALIVEQVMPPLCRYELRQHNSEKVIRMLCVDLLDVLQERLHQ